MCVWPHKFNVFGWLTNGWTTIKRAYGSRSYYIRNAFDSFKGTLKTLKTNNSTFKRHTSTQIEDSFYSVSIEKLHHTKKKLLLTDIYNVFLCFL